ncbi:hypothetical protein HBH70_188000 [Parastagonospora nodorum]|nr:hypothetical protein HBI95_197220 [Parastagonospora nodorum]KAH4952733.1 hypothetical protein HBI78_236420 [Parastagonospora nodorum]KAH5130735.1 hypothetical protein HBH70_188000 [Parastagonospora nodorum]KAH5147742.1 hypothetical protein HBH69_166660 [Parastagonospora nodorum]KAH5173479.1 hypothetical protein HBH77_208330 [Parastagonospora nodorum]
MAIIQEIWTSYAALLLVPPIISAPETSTTVPQVPSDSSTTEMQKMHSIFGPDSIAYQNEIVGPSHSIHHSLAAIHDLQQTTAKHSPAYLKTTAPSKFELASTVPPFAHASLHKDVSDYASHPAEAPNSERPAKQNLLVQSRETGTMSPQYPRKMHTDTSESIIRTIHDFIEEERRHNFCFLGKHAHRFMGHRDLLIVSLATCDDIRAALGNSGDLHPQEYTQDWYTFEEPKGNNPSHTVAIALTHGENLRIENLAICIPRRKPEPCFIRADAWLRETYNWDDEWDMRFTKMQYEKQQAWWKNNGQSFRIFDLPQELRDAVYLQMVGPVVLPDTHHGRVVIGKGLSYGSAERLGRNRDADIDRANMTVMRVCKAFREEATIVANRDTYKRLRQVAHTRAYNKICQPFNAIPNILASIISNPPHALFLRNIQLEMSAAAYFASINIVPGHNDPFASQVGAFELRNLTRFPALRNLDFRFISPKHPGALCPWAKADGTSVHGAHACQKIWIDWLFTLAWRTLRTLGASHPVRYTLSGCVKTSTKLLWERLLNDAHTDQTVDMQAEEAMIRATYGPGECKCTTRCSRKEAGEGRVCVFTEYEIKAIDGLKQHVDDMYWRFED